MLRHLTRTLSLIALAALMLCGVSNPAPTATGFGATDTVRPVSYSAARASADALERRVIVLTNRQRTARGCRALSYQSNLHVAARRHTSLMARQQTMSHRLRGEAGLGQRITAAGYTRWSLVAENVARGFDSAESVVRAWMASPGHRRNILNCRLRHIGVGVSLAHGQIWWTQNFGVKQ